MGKRILLNVLYNVALITLGICIIWGVKHQQYLISVGGVLIAALVIFLKLRLIKEVKEFAKKRQ